MPTGRDKGNHLLDTNRRLCPETTHVTLVGVEVWCVLDGVFAHGYLQAIAVVAWATTVS